MTIKDITIEKLIRDLEQNAWNGKLPQKAYIFNNNNIIELHGYTYEPVHEMFSTTHSVRINGDIIFKENMQCGYKTVQKEIEHIKDCLGEQEISIQYNKLEYEEQEEMEV